MFYRMRKAPTVTTRYVRGPLFGPEALDLAGQLADLNLRKTDELILSFINIRRIDTSGLVALVRLYSQCSVNRVTLRIIDVSPAVEKHLAKLGLAGLIGLDPEMAASRVTLDASIESVIDRDGLLYS
jgi:anti-anti-sigma factor